jgi:thiamine-phosphate pyrophosphorylase
MEDAEQRANDILNGRNTEDLEFEDLYDWTEQQVAISEAYETIFSSVEEALCAEKGGADYLGVGAVFPTSSKDDASDVSFEILKEICEAVSIPVIAIGGISKENVHKLSGAGIVGIAVISAIFGKEDIKQAAIDLKKETRKALYD